MVTAEIKWFHERDPVGNRIFDSWWEADEWADSILTDFYPFDNIGYMTPDEKVMACLLRRLPPYIRGCDWEATVHTATDSIDGKTVFKIWTTRQGSPS